jgi:myo-inositol-1-phosphate synthase
MPVEKQAEISPAEGKLGVLLVGLGAVSTTFIAGVEAIKKGIAQPIGSLTQMGTIRLGKRTDNRVPLIKDFVPLAQLKDLVFGAWDIFPDSAYDAALNAGVLEKELLGQLKEPLRKIKPMKAVFDQTYVKRLSGTNVKTGKNKFELAQQLIDEIAVWKRKNKCSRVVMIWAASTEIFLKPHPVHKTLDSFETGDAREPQGDRAVDGLRLRRAQVRNSFREWRAESYGRHPALRTLAEKNKLAICGKDFKTGQTLMKTIIAPGLKSRMLGLHGWYSTNILGNRDGEVLDDPDSFKTKEESKLSVLEYILQPDVYPTLVQRLLTRCANQLLPAARRQQRRLGQHRHLRLARLSDADQDRLSLSRFDSGCADRSRPCSLFRSRSARRNEGCAGVALFLLQVSANCARLVSRARHLHSVDETQEHAAALAR